MGRLGEDLVFLEDDADEFALGMSGGVAVVADVARGAGVDGVVASLHSISLPVH